jgi:hypothetical protein
MHMARCALPRRAQRASPKAADIRLAAAIRPRHAISSNASMQSGASQGCFRDASLKESRATGSLLLSVTKSVQKRCMATLFTSRKGHPAPRSRYSCSTCRAQRALEKIGRRCDGQGASFRNEDARCAPEAAALIGNLIAPDRSSPQRTASEHGESQRKGQLNRHTRYRATDQPLPHETPPRSGRAARWTNTPARIFKDPAPTPTTSQSVPPTPPTALRRPLRDDEIIHRRLRATSAVEPS